MGKLRFFWAISGTNIGHFKIHYVYFHEYFMYSYLILFVLLGYLYASFESDSFF